MLVYAINEDGRAVHVDEVANGKACGCVCPQCGGALVAYNGSKWQAHHFSHTADAVRECEWAAESALHLMAKKIIVEARSMVFPELMVPPLDVWIEAGISDGEPSVLVSEAREVEIAGVALERRTGAVVPDVVVSADYGGGRRVDYAVEIAVTHFVDDDKIGKLREQGLSTIEVDLSCVDGGISREDLSSILLGDSVLKRWVYSAKVEQVQRRHPRSVRRRKGVRLCGCEDHGMVNGADRFEWCPPGNHLHYGDCMNCINCVDADIRVRHGRYGRFARVEAIYCDVDAAEKRAASRKRADKPE